MKRFLSVLVVMAMLLAFMPVIANAETSGTCGDNLTWTLDDDGTLTISGGGAMENYSVFNEAPFYEYCYIKTVVIENGVTSVGDYAFQNAAALTSVTMPDSVTSIGDSAFSDCSSLTSVTMPDSVTSIGDSAFSDCSSLTSITIPDSVTTIGGWAFSDCSSLTSVTIPDSVTTIGNCAFAYCSSLTSVAIPDGVTEIGQDTFRDCSSLTSITIPTSVTNISGVAFNGCGSLNIIVDEANEVFSSVDGVLFNKDKTELVKYAKDATNPEYIIPDGVTIIDSWAFSGCDSLTSITIPNSITDISMFSVFDGCSSLSITVDEGNKVYSSVDGVVFNKDKTELVAYTKDAINPEYIIPDGVTTIGQFAFSGCSSLTSIIIPNGVAGIGYNAFRDCSSLTSIIIPDSVTSIGGSAFGDCGRLTNVAIPASVTSIGDSAFHNTADYYNRNNWESGCFYIGNCLLGTEWSDEYTIKNGTRIIADGAFESSSDLTSIEIPDSVISIGDSAFSACSSLTSITIPDSVARIDPCAFIWCGSLNITVDEGNEVYSSVDGVLFNKDKTELVKYAKDVINSEYIIPDSVTTIGYDAFAHCSSLTAITIPHSVTRIEQYAFGWCDNLTDVYYNGTEVEWAAVSKSYDSGLQSVTIHCSDTIEPTPTPLPITTATVTKTVTDTEYIIEVTPETAYEDCYVCVGLFDANDTFIGIKIVPLELTGSTTVSVNKEDGAERAKVFIWADTMQPIIEAAEIALITE